jgi:sec-independent protein translocase protein TatB
MFDIGWDEMTVVAVVALIVIGPKDLPVVLRQAGRWVRKARAMAAEFQSGVEEMVREAELREMRDKVAQVASPDALQQQIQSAIDLDSAFDDFDRDMKQAPTPLPAPTGATAESRPGDGAPPDHGAPSQVEEMPLELPETAPFDSPSRPPKP